MTVWSAAPTRDGRVSSLATEPKKPAGAAKTASRSGKSTSNAAEVKAVEARLSALESELKGAEQRLAERAAALESRIGALEDRDPASATLPVPAGLANAARQALDRSTEFIRRNPVVALILIFVFLLVALFS